MTEPNDRITQTTITPDNGSNDPSGQPSVEAILADPQTAHLLIRVLVFDLAVGWQLDDQQLAILSGEDVAVVQAWRRKQYLSRVGVIRPPRVGIYRPLEVIPRSVSNDPVQGSILLR